MQLIVVTGMSGAGKTTVLKILEDLDYYCVDNLPPMLISRFIEVCYETEPVLDKVAIGIDIRGGKLFSDLLPALSEIDMEKFGASIIFLEASDQVLMKRFTETRRGHPLARDTRIIDGIVRERELMAGIKKKSTHIVDTSHILTRELREKIYEITTGGKDFDSLMITVMTFGFKYGLPTDSDLVFDVRFLPNPFYIPELKQLTGEDKPVQDYVMGYEAAKTFLEKACDMLGFLIPHYISEGKNQLVIAVGCTGGRHRSVTLGNEIFRFLRSMNLNVNIRHRDSALHL